MATTASPGSLINNSGPCGASVCNRVRLGPSLRYPLLGPHRVRTTLAADSTPSTTIDAAAKVKKFAAVASCVDSQPPPAATNTSRAVCASTGPKTFAAPCEEKSSRSTPDERIHWRCGRQNCRLAARTPGSWVKISTQRSGRSRSRRRRGRPTQPNATRDHCDPPGRATWPPPIAIPTIGTDAMPTANASEVSMISSRAPIHIRPKFRCRTAPACG